MIYLLIFDRELAETIVKEQYPSEGAHYLEKIVQASFDIPEPRKEDMRDQMLQRVGDICGSPSDGDMVRFMNVFYDVVAPEIRTPRDLVRLANSLSVTWPAIGQEVDLADFVGLETLRLLQPSVYRAVRSSKGRLTGGSDSGGTRYSAEQKAEYEKTLLGGIGTGDRPRLQTALKRLFPRLDSVWGNLSYGHDSVAGWERQRRVCADSRFDTYFRLYLGDNALKKDEIEALVARAADGTFVRESLRKSLGVIRYGGTTKAALILDELNLHADAIADADVQPLLTAIFEIADELDTPRDEAKGFSFGDNRLRTHWLLRRLIMDRFDLTKRSAVLLAACKTASVGWLVDLADSANTQHISRDGKLLEPLDRRITTERDAGKLQTLALKGIREAANSGILAGHAKLPYLLYRWRDLAKDDGKTVKRWTKARLADDSGVADLARAFTSHGWTHGSTDRVSQRTTMANVKEIDQILDAKLFRSRIAALLEKKTLSAEEMSALSVFENAWQRQDSGERF